MWNLAPPPGFRGFDEQRPVSVYARRLPHWRQDGATYFVTFRLADSLPEARMRELDDLRDAWKRRFPPPHSHEVLERLARTVAARIERWLDESYGSCLLAQPALAEHLVKSLHHFDGERYELGAYVVLPNHAHALVRPTQPNLYPLESVVGGWKQHSSLKIAKAIGTAGGLWQEESHDRIIRDEEHLYRALQYIGHNPRKAGLTRAACPIWVRPEWEALGWKFDRE